jgi:hypothetical protein
LIASSTLVIANFLQVLLLQFLVDHYAIRLPKKTSIAKIEARYGLTGVFFFAVVAGTWVETLLGQALPMVLTRALRKPAVPFLVIATVWFACLHARDQGLEVMILSHLVLALILAGTFLRGWHHSWWRGIWMTTIVHAVGNLSLFLYELATYILARGLPNR